MWAEESKTHELYKVFWVIWPFKRDPNISSIWGHFVLDFIMYFGLDQLLSSLLSYFQWNFLKENSRNFWWIGKIFKELSCKSWQLYSYVFQNKSLIYDFNWFLCPLFLYFPLFSFSPTSIHVLNLIHLLLTYIFLW